MFKFSGQRPTNLGVKDGRLAACPGTPNCVCSQSDRPQEKIAPLPLVSMDKLRQVIEGMERTAIIEQTDNYLYAEFTTKLMGFVDDVEFFNDGSAIQVRSASRLGKSDLNLNRQRVEAIRAALG
jgi:uncharacterized protein (DUF1499 family)